MLRGLGAVALGAAVAAGAAAAAPHAREQIVFVRYLPGDAEIFAMTADGRNQRPLVAGAGDAGEPAFAPDGRRIAFSSSRADGSQGISIAAGDGSHVRRLTSHRYIPTKPVLDDHPRWSPDGKTIVFHRSVGSGLSDVYSISANGGSAKRLFSGYDASWTPDGRRILFADRPKNGGNYDLYVAAGDGRSRRRLTTSTANDTDAASSPDGRKIAFVRQLGANFELFVTSGNPSSERRLTTHPAIDINPAWSPDGRRLAFARRVGRQYDVFVLSLATRRAVRLTRDPHHDAQPTWLRAGD